MGKLKLKSKHRLLCGDSTIEDDVARLMDGGKIESVVTDPPYGMEIDPLYCDVIVKRWENLTGEKAVCNG